jgi:hypothetical protein
MKTGGLVNRPQGIKMEELWTWVRHQVGKSKLLSLESRSEVVLRHGAGGGRLGLTLVFLAWRVHGELTVFGVPW